MDNFILQKFKEYYRNAKLEILKPEMREFGIGNKKKIDARHLSFETLEQFRGYLVANTPLFTSHSTAYYLYPEVTPIGKKGWKGSDLVFDLDIHAEGKYGAYKHLDTVKEDALRLVDDFLVDDFAIDKKKILLVFSGNRGYHIHVRDDSFLLLGSDERKEIVNYIQGTGLDYRNFFKKEELGRKVFKILGPAPSEDGYRGRFARTAIKKINTKPEDISRILKKDETQREEFIKGIETGNWSRTRVNDIVERMRIVAEELPLKTVETDTGVTQDIRKLIRVPNSLHGETGFIAKVVNDVNTFNPLSNALLNSSNDIRIQMNEDVKIELADQTFDLKKDEKVELKDTIAMFFILKQSANLA